jgi:hypothetical protein
MLLGLRGSRKMIRHCEVLSLNALETRLRSSNEAIHSKRDIEDCFAKNARNDVMEEDCFAKCARNDVWKEIASGLESRFLGRIAPAE